MAKQRPPFELFLIGTLASFAPFLILGWNRLLGHDFPYFTSLSLFVRSALLNYGAFPLFDPWLCGGLNVLANPQARLFSPLAILDVLLPPDWANVAGLMIYCFLGQWGMFRLLEALDVRRSAAILVSVLFAHSSWFGLHISAGHVTFGSMQLLPWVAFAYLRLREPRMLWLLGVLLSLFLLDGAVYTFVFALLLLVTLAALKPRTFVDGLSALDRRYWVWAGLCVVGSALTASPKLVPILAELRDRPPHLEALPISLSLLLRSFFFPFQKAGGMAYPYGFHEIGSYLGIVAVVVVARSFRRDWLRLLLAMGLWLFIAGSWLESVNPWNQFFQRIPLINNVHAQSRTLIFFHLGFLVLLAKSLSNMKLSWKSHRGLIVFLVAEALIVKNYSQLQTLLQSPTRPIGFEMIQSQTVSSTLPGHRVDRSPRHYLDEPDTGLQVCYEPSIRHLPVPVRSQRDPAYRGEIYLEDTSGFATIARFVPNELVVDYQDLEGSRLIQVNTRGWPHWKVEQGDVERVEHSSGLLAIRARGPTGKAVLRFSPSYFPWVVGAFVAGVLLLFTLALRPVSSYFQP